MAWDYEAIDKEMGAGLILSSLTRNGISSTRYLTHVRAKSVLAAEGLSVESESVPIAGKARNFMPLKQMN